MNGRIAKKHRKEARMRLSELFGNICNGSFVERFKLALSILLRKDYFAGTGESYRTKEKRR